MTNETFRGRMAIRKIAMRDKHWPLQYGITVLMTDLSGAIALDTACKGICS